jgi:glycosyltransferase involved in cell wall biosynthesis
MVAIEAMASGVPVMALKRGGMAEYMVDGDNARLLGTATTPAQLARAIEAAAADEKELSRLARNARAMVEARFDWTNIARETEGLYDILLNTAGIMSASEERA